MSRAQSRTLSALGIKWRLIPGGFRLFLLGREREVASFEEALDFAALCYRGM